MPQNIHDDEALSLDSCIGKDVSFFMHTRDVLPTKMLKITRNISPSIMKILFAKSEHSYISRYIFNSLHQSEQFFVIQGASHF